MGNLAIKLTSITEDNLVDVVMEMEKFVGRNQLSLIAYNDAMMFRRMMEIKTKAKYLVERHMYDTDTAPLGKGFRYYLPECDFYLELITYDTGVLHIECLKNVEDEDIDDDTEVFVTKFKIETVPNVAPMTIYLREPEDSSDENIRKLLYWIQKGFGKIVDLKEIFRKSEE